MLEDAFNRDKSEEDELAFDSLYDDVYMDTELSDESEIDLSGFIDIDKSDEDTDIDGSLFDLSPEDNSDTDNTTDEEGSIFDLVYDDNTTDDSLFDSLFGDNEDTDFDLSHNSNGTESNSETDFFSDIDFGDLDLAIDDLDLDALGDFDETSDNYDIESLKRDMVRLIEESKSNPDLLRESKNEVIMDSLSFILWCNDCQFTVWSQTLSDEASNISDDLEDIKDKYRVSDSVIKLLYETVKNYFDNLSLFNNDENPSINEYGRSVIDNYKNALKAQISTLPQQSFDWIKLQTKYTICLKMLESNKMDIHTWCDFISNISLDSKNLTAEIIRFFNDCKDELKNLVNAIIAVWNLYQNVDVVHTDSYKRRNSFINQLEEDKAIIQSNPESGLCDAFSIPVGISVDNGKFEITCECGAVTSFDDLVIFNFINSQSNRNRGYSSPTDLLNDYLNSGNDTIVEYWLSELKDYKTVFNHPDNRMMIDRLSRVDGGKKDQVGFIKNYYGCACTFSIDCNCSGCGKTIVLQPKLLRYLSAWHFSHGTTICRKYRDSNIAPGRIIYKSEQLRTKLAEFRDTTLASDVSDIKSFWASDANKTKPEARIKRALVESNLEVSRPEKEFIIDVSVEEAYKRLRKRQSGFTMQHARFVDNRNTQKELLDDTKYFVITDWENYNGSSDKLISGLYSIAKCSNPNYPISPDYLLNMVLNADTNEHVKNTLKKTYYSRCIKFAKKILDVLMIKTDTGYKFKSISTPNIGLYIGDNYVDTLITFIKNALKFLDIDIDTNDYIELKSIIEKLDVDDYDYNRLKIVNRVSNLIKFDCDFVHTVGNDNDIMRLITDELPWKVWYEMALTQVIKDTNVEIINSYAPSSATKANKSRKGVEAIYKTIEDFSKFGIPGERSVPIWNKVPVAMLDGNIPVLKGLRTMDEVCVASLPIPMPFTDKLVSIIFGCKSVDKAISVIDVYTKGDWRADLENMTSSDNTEISYVDNLDAGVALSDIVYWYQSIFGNDVLSSFGCCLKEYVNKQTKKEESK